MELLVVIVLLGAAVGIYLGFRARTKTSAAQLPAFPHGTALPLLHSVEAHIALRRGETAHLVVETELMKNVVDRESRGSHHGMSFRVAKGVRFYTGSSRGKMVTVGSHLEVEDRGQLTVTSQRTVFTGLKRTIEIPHVKVLQVTSFLNGVQLHASNRVNPPLFRVARHDSALLGAVLGAAQQHALSSDTADA